MEDKLQVTQKTAQTSLKNEYGNQRSFKYETKMPTSMRKTKMMKDTTGQKDVTQKKNLGRNGEYEIWKEGRGK